MKCQDINQTIYDYCEDTLSPDLNFEFTQHLNNCVSCRNNYRLTLVENEVLSDTGDIPSLSDSFMPVLMSSLKSINSQGKKSQPLLNKNKRSAFSRALWYCSLAVTAAVISLCLYISQWFNMSSKVEVANNNSVVQQESHAITLINPIRSSNVNAYANSKSESIEQVKTETRTEENNLKSNQIAEDVISSLSISSLPLSSDEKLSTSLQAENQKPNTSTLALSPQNIPDSFKLVKSSKVGGKKTVYDYISLDGKENLQLIVVNSNKDTFVINSVNNKLSHNNSTVIRIIQMENMKITATFSGNLSTEELTSIANKIQFKVDDAK